jgi:hypothetical protein
MAMLRPGMVVECINASDFEPVAWRGDTPVLGAKYTITGVHIFKNETHLVLAEIRNCSFNEYSDVGYRAIRFRPIVERKTDISILKALLIPGAKILEDAQ